MTRLGTTRKPPADTAAHTTAAETEAACRETAMRLLDRRPHSRVELARKLGQRQFPPAVAGLVLADLERLGLVNDSDYARAYCEAKLHGSRALGQARLRLDLRRRGLDPEVIRDALGEVGDTADPEAEAGRALELARRKWLSVRRAADPHEARAKVLRFLAGRGFSPAACRAAADTLRREESTTA